MVNGLLTVVSIKGVVRTRAVLYAAPELELVGIKGIIVAVHTRARDFSYTSLVKKFKYSPHLTELW